LFPEELERDRRAVWVVFMAYGWGFGLSARSFLVDEPRGSREAEGRVTDAVMAAMSQSLLIP
jgi:hypothetical protein